MKVKCCNFNLLKLHDSEIWHQLITLTKQNGIAREHFAHIQYSNLIGKYNNFTYKIAKIRCAFVDDKIVAWGVVIEPSKWLIRRLWLFTDPEYRKMGIQKNYILPYFRRYYPNCDTQQWNNFQRETFKYYSE